MSSLLFGCVLCALSFGIWYQIKHLLSNDDDVKETYEQPSTYVRDDGSSGNTIWLFEQPLELDISKWESSNPIQNAYYYGDSPEILQELLDTNINCPNYLKTSNFTNIKSWRQDYSKDDLNVLRVHDMLELFLWQSSLHAKGYYIALSKLQSYDQSTDGKVVKLGSLVCVHKPDTTYAKTISIICYITLSPETQKHIYVLTDCKVRGIIHQSHLPL